VKVKVKVKVEKNLEKTVQNVGSLNLAMISLPYREKLLSNPEGVLVAYSAPRN
jgi:hypothetical protein